LLKQFDKDQQEMVYVSSLAKDVLEQIVFEARESEFVDVKSGVSARLSITAYENLISTAERSTLLAGEEKTTVRLSDFMGIIPAITGKVELVYEGEQEGAATVAQYLIGDAIKTLFPNYFPKIEKLERENEKNAYTELLEWFFTESGFELQDDYTNAEYQKTLEEVKPLENIIQKYQPEFTKEDKYFLKEFILWGLVEHEKLSKNRFQKGYEYKDLYSNYIHKL
jgi:magnesium chelatase subunit I